MKEFKGTPGEWEIEDNNPHLPCFDIVSKCEDTYISVYTITEEAIHNANLIAAAPELLSALQELLIDIRIAQGNMRDAAKADKRWDGCAESFQSRIDTADTAIAKALGESQ